MQLSVKCGGWAAIDKNVHLLVEGLSDMRIHHYEFSLTPCTLYLPLHFAGVIQFSGFSHLLMQFNLFYVDI